MRLRLLDGFELLRGDQAVGLALPPQRVLALLALSGRTLHREYVAETLWGDRDQQRSAASLRSALCRLRDIPGVVHVNRVHLRLDDLVRVDVRDQETLARRLLAADVPSGPPAEVRVDPAACARSLDRDLLPDWYDDWTIIERERLRQLRIGALEQLSHHWRHARRFGLAVDAALAAIRAEPMREAAHAALIEAHLDAGNRAEALRCYEFLTMMLDEELGLRPSPALQDRVAEVLMTDRQLPVDRGLRRATPSARATSGDSRPQPTRPALPIRR
ncbi:BTAD domain-containing putative transcriptional regulator [Geodermatophilus sp. SYSU D00804]